jgi:hypothetical protein
VQLPTPLSGFVTVTVRLPIVAFDATLIVAVSLVLEFHTVDATVTPGPKPALAPETKPVPVMTTGLFVVDRGSDPGVAVVTVGAASTVKQEHVVVPPLGLVTVMFVLPTVAVGLTLTLRVIVVAVTVGAPLAVTPGFANVTLAPAWNPWPEMTTRWALARLPSAAGVTAEMTGSAGTLK